MKPIRIGTRRSQLALWQANYVRDQLQQLYPQRQIELVEFTTRGDQVLDRALPEVGGKGLFTQELEQALTTHKIDLAVHSLKDLPTQMPEGVMLGAIPKRAAPFDSLVSRSGKSLDQLPQGATIGTSSLRRAAQLREYRADFKTESIRGNVETRIRKATDPDGMYDATILAAAGLERLGLQQVITQRLTPEIMLPAPGQGALGIQVRAEDAEILALLAPLNHVETRAAVTAERAFLETLEAGCSLPVSAYVTVSDEKLHFSGKVSDIDGTAPILVTGEGHLNSAYVLGSNMAVYALERGAGDLLAKFNKLPLKDRK